MFDERSSIWIRLLKGFVVYLFVAIIVASVSLAFVDSINEYILGFDAPFLTFLLWTIFGANLAFVVLIVGMLLVNYLNNVQRIRECVESKEMQSFGRNVYEEKPTSFTQPNVHAKVEIKEEVKVQPKEQRNLIQSKVNTKVETQKDNDIDDILSIEKALKDNYLEEYEVICLYYDKETQFNEWEKAIRNKYKELFN